MRTEPLHPLKDGSVHSGVRIFQVAVQTSRKQRCKVNPINQSQRVDGVRLEIRMKLSMNPTNMSLA